MGFILSWTPPRGGSKRAHPTLKGIGGVNNSYKEKTQVKKKIQVKNKN